MTTLVNRGSDEPSPEQKRALLKELLRRKSESPRTAPLSSGQERLWFLDQLTPGSPLYVECGAVRIREPLNTALLERALNEVVRRHEILRTTFVEQDGRPVQRIAPALLLKIGVESIAPGGEAERERWLRERIREETRRPFRLAEGPLLRVTLLRLGPRDTVALIAIHHIVCDGWSIGVLIGEVVLTYQALVAGRVSPLAPLPMQYADYAAWQRATLEGAAAAAHLAYWKERFAGRPPALRMPTDHPPTPARVPPGATRSYEIRQALGESVRELSRVEGVTLFMTLLAAFKVLLREYAEQDEITVVSPIAGRTRPEHEPLVGFFVNSLLLRTELSGDPSFRAVVRRVRDTVLGALAHQEVPFDRVVAAVVPPRARRGSETVPVAFALHHDLTAPLAHSGLRAERMEVDPGTAKADLTLFFWVGQSALRASIEYRTDVYAAATIERLWSQYVRLLERVTADADQSLSELEMLSGEERAALRARREAAEAVEPAGQPAVEHLTNLSEDQFLIWMDQQLQPESPLFNLVTIFRVEAELDPVHFRRAWAELVRGRESLRTVFEVENGLPRRRVLSEVRAEVPVIDLSHEADAEAALRSWAARRVERVFDLRRPSFEIVMLRLGVGRWAVYFNQHHINCDGWSASVLVRDLAELYAASRAGRMAALSPVPSFDEYVEHLRGQRDTDAFRAASAYWAEKVKAHGVEPLTFYGRANRLRSTRTRRIEVALGAERSARIEALARTEAFAARTAGLAYLQIFAAALAVWVQRISGCDRFALATPLANRPAAFRRTPGQFMKVVPLFVEVEEQDTAATLARRIGGELRGAMANAQVSVRNPRNSVYEMLINLQHRPEYPDFDGAAIRSEFPAVRHENLSLALHVWPPRREQREFLLHFDLLCEVFDEERQGQAVEHFLRVLDATLAEPERRLGDISLVTAAEREVLLTKVGAGPVVPLPARSLWSLFAEQAARTPEAPAVESADGRVTYGELRREAERIAARLRAAGVAPGERVGVYLPRSIELIASLLGVLRAGAAYVPLDADWPAERRAFVVEDAQLRVMLTTTALAGNLADAGELTVIRVDARDAGGTTAALPADDVVSAAAEAAVYVIYTSGSTGRPKGVVIAQRGAVNYILEMVRAFGVVPQDRMLMFHSPAFDSSAEEIFPPLLGGATIVLRGEELPAPGEEWARYVRERRLTLISVPAAYWHEWMAESAREMRAVPETVKLVLTGGERVLGKHYATWVKLTGGRVRWINSYGPTEISVACTMDEVAAGEELEEGSDPPIGRPLANVRVYVVDRALQLVPPGVPGELCVGGVGVSPGYLHRPELTAARFVADPFVEEPGARMYRTGDRVRWRSDGRLEFLGRLDRQIKLRGFRIEPGEIEAALRGHAGVREAAVVLRESGGGGARLVAYVTAGAGGAPAAADLQRHVGQQLPAHMVPSNVIVVDEFPRTAGGKVDLSALAAREDEAGAAGETYVAPRTPLEVSLAAIWGDVLGISHVGVHDDFFELGGHSLLATQVMSRVRAANQVELPLRVLFESPTIAELAEHVLVAQAEANLREAPPIVPVARVGDPPLSYAQQRLWVLEQLLPGAASTMNIPGGVRLSGPLHVEAIQRAMNEVFRRHESLRTTIAVVEGKPVQRIAREVRFEMPIVDLSGLPAAAREEEARRRATAIAAEPFDLSRGPLMRALLIRLAPNEHIMVVVMHHIVADGWSINIAIREFVLLYPSLAAGRGVVLPDPPVQYADFAHWQRQRMESEVGERLLAYWRGRLAPPLPSIEWPMPRSAPALPSLRGRTRPVRFEAGMVAELRRLAQREGCTLYMVLLTALNTLIHRYSGAEDVIIGSPIANRTRVEAEGLIGYVANTLVLRSDVSGNPTFRELMQRVREVLLAAYAHQELPFELLVESLGRGADPVRGAMFQVLLILHNAPSTTVSFHDLKLSIYDLDPGTAPFDITLFLNDTAGVLDGHINYRTDVFDDEDIERLLGHFEALLRSAASAPDTMIGSLPLLTARERRLIEGEGGSARAKASGAETIPQALARAAAGAGAAARFAASAQRAARRIAASGVARGERVAVCHEDAAELSRAAAGVLAAGAAVVALALNESDEFLARVLREGGVKRAVAQGAAAARLAQLGVQVIDAGEANAGEAECAGEDVCAAIAAAEDAYWVYEVSAEGLPQLAGLSQAGLAAHCADMAEELRLGAGDRVMLVGGGEVHRAIEVGLAAALYGAEAIGCVEMDAAALWERMEQESATVVVLPAAGEPAEFVISARAALPDCVRLIVTEGARGTACVEGAESAPAGGAEWVDLERVRGAGLTTLVHRPLTEPGAAAPGARMLTGRVLGRARLVVVERGLLPAPIGVRGTLAVLGITAPSRVLGAGAARGGAGPIRVAIGGDEEPAFLTSRAARLRPEGQIELL